MHRPKILLVEDVPLLLRLAEKMLSPLEADLSTAENGRAAWEIMNREPADIVVTDLIMPEMDGFELIDHLRADGRFQHIFILVMTALDDVDDKVRALSEGANDYVVKPLEPQEFRARVAGGIREIVLKRELARTLTLLDDELKAVAKIQKKLLPVKLPDSDLVRCAVSYQPWSRSGGDYYNACYDEQGRLALSLADVSGHGAGAAVLMAMFRVIQDLTLPQGGDSRQIISLFNQKLLQQIGGEPSFITTALALIDPQTRSLDYCSAGHGDQFLIGPEPGRLIRLKSGGPVLGFFDYQWQNEKHIIPPGQTLILFTDGLIEAVNQDGEEFGQKRLEAALTALDPATPPKIMVETLLAQVKNFSGPVEFSDDVTIFVAKF